MRARAARLVDQALEQVVRALRTFALEHRLERVEPLLGFQRVGIVGSRELWNGRHVDEFRFLLQGGEASLTTKWGQC